MRMWKLKRRIINILVVLLDKVDIMQEQMGNINDKILIKNQKEMVATKNIKQK
jgi:hypothetical protein